ncbi:DUF4129 domain-containing protein [Haloarcula salina]|uniref:DUF4129 domain-containing protein n=1 Tax=Haloarcula salina TaxID=1429914 RepID=UPI003C7039B8
MQRQSLLVAVVAAVALLSFSVGAASIDAAVGRDDAELSPDDGDIENTGERRLEDPPGGIDPPSAEGGARALLPSVPAPAVGGVIAVVAAAVVALWRFAGDGQTVDETSGETPTSTATAAEAAVPSRTARDVDVPLTNDVYRAWATLESQVTPDGASTPRDVAADAATAGADPDAVDALRDLFERVRYGTETPDSETEARAREALDRATESDGGVEDDL